MIEPKVPNAPHGRCRWCGDKLTGKNAQRRNYCYPDREKKNCRFEYKNSFIWNPRDVIIYMAIQNKEFKLRCVDCKEICAELQKNKKLKDIKSWDADHIIPLWNKGKHHKDNLCLRCKDCHKIKTAREASERAAIMKAKEVQR